MGLITIADLELASGQDIAVEDEPRCQWFIDAVSAYIETYTDESFVSVEDVELMCQADSYGVIQFPSLNGVSKVEEYEPWTQTYTEWTTGTYAFNGIDSVYGLTPYITYRLTVSYGYDEVPVDVAAVATQLVLAGSGLDPNATGGLSKYRVGDVEESYGVVTDASGHPVVTLASMQTRVLDAYNQYTRTLRL